MKSLIQTRRKPSNIPEIAHTRSGVAFTPSEDIWDFVDGVCRVHLDFSKLALPGETLVSSLKSTLFVYTKLNSPNYVINLFNQFAHFLSKRVGKPPLTKISVEEVIDYAAALGSHETWRVGTLSGLLQKWQRLGLPGVDTDCTQFLREQRKPGNIKGQGVRTRDPITGPFSEDEYIALYKAVDSAYAAGQVPLWTVVLTRILFATGARVSQCASLKSKDFSQKEGKYILSLPQVKNRAEHSRADFKYYDISPQTGRLILAHIKNNQVDGWDDDAPIFLASEVNPTQRNLRRDKTDIYFGHCIASSLSKKFTNIISEFAPATERLNFDQMPVNTKRFRATFGTRLAEEGASRAEIADRLGHTDLQNVDVYFENSPAVVENIDKAVGKYLAPLSLAFRGRLIESEDQSTLKGEPGSRIIDFRIASRPLANCAGGCETCAFNKPVACYTCFRFEPWLDAPHEKVLEHLEEERKRFKDDIRLAAINDDAIAAVREVIAQCSLVRQQNAMEASA